MIPRIIQGPASGEKSKLTTKSCHFWHSLAFLFIVLISGFIMLQHIVDQCDEHVRFMQCLLYK